MGCHLAHMRRRLRVAAVLILLVASVAAVP